MRKLCLVSARNLGDAVIHADLLATLVASGFADRYVVWTFAQAEFLFQGLANCTVYVSAFPMGATVESFVPRGIPSFLRTLRLVRREQPTHTLDLITDVRERAVCRLLGARRNFAPRWPAGHPFLKHIRSSPIDEKDLIPIPADVTGLYAAYQCVLRAMMAERGVPVATQSTSGRPQGLRIGVHPFASLPCKLWPQQHWLTLFKTLRERHPDSELVLFGAPSDRAALQEVSARLAAPAEVFTSSLSLFKERLRRVDLLLGLDSFAVHLAHSLGVPSIALIGPNDPRLFTPPTTTAVTHPGNCPYQPCNGKPQCVGSTFQYVCMSSITPEQVAEQIILALDRRALAPPLTHKLPKSNSE
jgi:heptosyltransferase-3